MNQITHGREGFFSPSIAGRRPWREVEPRSQPDIGRSIGRIFQSPGTLGSLYLVQVICDSRSQVQLPRTVSSLLDFV